jgi:hypothetical protein
MVKKKKEEQAKQIEIDNKLAKEAELAEAGAGAATPITLKNLKIEEPKVEVPSLLSGYDATEDQDVFFK